MAIDPELYRALEKDQAFRPQLEGVKIGYTVECQIPLNVEFGSYLNSTA